MEFFLLSLVVMMVTAVGSFLAFRQISSRKSLSSLHKTPVDYELTPPEKLDYDYIDWLERKLGVGKYDNALLEDFEYEYESDYEFEDDSDYDPEILNAQPVDESWAYVRFKKETPKGSDGYYGRQTKKSIAQFRSELRKKGWMR